MIELSLILVCSIVQTQDLSEQILVSVVMSIYNTGRYLQESINSLIYQTLDFEKHIQLILVNDGSNDFSETICLHYQAKYPNNIVYKYQDNKGPSAARNLGLQFAKGLFINFLDSDDKWDPDALKILVSFIKNTDNVSIVTGRMQLFEAETGYHILDYKFSSTRVVDLQVDYDNIQLSAATCLIKRESLKGLAFCEQLRHQEDAHLINRILLNNSKIGIVKEALYYCRRRKDHSSSVQTSSYSRSYYLDSPQYFAKDLISVCCTKLGRVPLFIQYVIMYDLQWKLHGGIPSILSESEYVYFLVLITDILKDIEPSIIIQQKYLTMEEKIACLSQRAGYDIRPLFVFRNNCYYLCDTVIIDSSKTGNFITWLSVHITQDNIHLLGRDECLLDRDSYSYILKTSTKIISPTYRDYPEANKYTIFGLFQKGRTVAFSFPVPEKDEEICLFVRYSNHEYQIPFSFTSSHRFSRLVRNQLYSNGYTIGVDSIGNLNIQSFKLGFYLRTAFQCFWRMLTA